MSGPRYLALQVPTAVTTDRAYQPASAELKLECDLADSTRGDGGDNQGQRVKDSRYVS